MDIQRCVTALRPGVGAKVVENDVNQITMSDGSSPPTLAACQSVWPTVQAEIRVEETAKRIDELETDMAKGFFWLLKKLVQGGVIDIADVPQKIIDAYSERDGL